VKFLKDDKSTVTIKDTAIVNLTLSIKKLDRNIAELNNKIEEAKVKAKEYLLKKEKQVNKLNFISASTKRSEEKNNFPKNPRLLLQHETLSRTKPSRHKVNGI